MWSVTGHLIVTDVVSGHLIVFVILAFKNSLDSVTYTVYKEEIKYG